MFFEAMRRKGYSSDAKDMKTIVPIHNAVNERAWKEIKEWERPWGGEEKYGSPQYLGSLVLIRIGVVVPGCIHFLGYLQQ